MIPSYNQVFVAFMILEIIKNCDSLITKDKQEDKIGNLIWKKYKRWKDKETRKHKI